MNNLSTTQKETVCPLDCADTCSLTAEITGQKIVKIKGSKINPFTQGVICEKVAKYYPDFVHGSNRLKQPLQRTGPRGSGEYQAISWETAIELCYEGIQKAIDQYGSETVLPFNYAGPHGQLAGGSMDRRFFYKLGASQLKREPLCAGVRSLAYTSMFGGQVAMPMEQAEHSDLIIIWGSNTSSTNLHLMKIINSARKKGAKLIVIDPQRTKISKIADLYLQITPTTDVFFALAIANTLNKQGAINKEQLKGYVDGLEQYLQHAQNFAFDDISNTCGIDKNQSDSFINLLKNAKTASMLTGVGLERSINGGSAIRAAMALIVLTNHFGKLGQGVMGHYGMAFPKNPARLQKTNLLPKETRRINILEVPDVILNEKINTPVKALFIYNHNPVVMNPNQNKIIKALSKEDIFIIGCDINMTDSMKYADVILPAASHFEHQDIYAAYGHTYLQRTQAVIPPVANALPNTEIFRRLSKRFGFDSDEFKATDNDLINDAFDIDKASSMKTTDCIAMRPLDQIWLSDGKEKINLFSSSLEKEYGFGLPQYQRKKASASFRLLTPASTKRSNGTFGGHKDSLSTQEVHINSLDAKRLNIQTGQDIKLKNQLGQVVLKALVGNIVAPGVVCSYKGAWLETSSTGQSINALIDNQSITDIGNGAAFYDTFVDIEII
ncbi:MAG: molybdopterin-dependent oxidoreductase [Gammaproteobacteria bacterium]|nr:molybdopterin-dependent oxidoreductase [Gammaproteobacteria bacterium]